MSECRKAFEAKYPGLTENAPQWMQWQKAWDAALSAAAGYCRPRNDNLEGEIQAAILALRSEGGAR